MSAAVSHGGSTSRLGDSDEPAGLKVAYRSVVGHKVARYYPLWSKSLSRWRSRQLVRCCPFSLGSSSGVTLSDYDALFPFWSGSGMYRTSHIFDSCVSYRVEMQRTTYIQRGGSPLVNSPPVSTALQCTSLLSRFHFSRLLASLPHLDLSKVRELPAGLDFDCSCSSYALQGLPLQSIRSIAVQTEPNLRSEPSLT